MFDNGLALNEQRQAWSGARDESKHFVRFYEDDSFLLDTVAKWLFDGVRAGDAAIVIGTEGHRKGLEAVFRTRGLEFEALRNQGLYIALDAYDTLSKFSDSGRPDKARFNSEIGPTVVQAVQASASGRVRAFGEMVALQWMDGNKEGAVQLERIWNDFIKLHSISLCCAYPLDAFRSDTDEKLFLRACAEHAKVIPAESYSALRTPDDRQRSITLLQHKAKLLERESTSRKQAEKSLRLHQRELADFLENATEGVHQLGPDGRILWANAAQLRLLQYSPEEYVGHHIREFYVNQRRFDEFWHRLMAHESVYDFETELRCKDGSTKHVVIHSSGHWESEKFLYTRCFMRDISERVRLEEELQTTIAQLATADRRKDEFLALLGHELRNPLGAVQNAIAAARLDQSRRDDMLEIAWRQTEQLSRLVGDLLDVARITQGKIRLQREAVRIGSIVERAVEQARTLIESRRQKLSILLAPQADAARIYADPARLQQIVGNLVHNAAKFTQAGGRILLTAELDGDEIFIRVSDNGPGLSKELLPRVFDLFAQADTSLARVQGGLGIGLTIVKKLVEMHGGRIQAKSEGTGKGSQFEVWLPLMTGTPQAVHQTQRSQPLNRSRVLVVEDNPDAAESLKLVLELYGHDVTLAANGLEAVDIMRVSEFDVALVDIGLPDIDGYEVARRIRALRKSKATVLAALTGYGQQRDKQTALAAGFDRHFMKPVDIGELHAFLGTIGS